jgi:hypothetical protein
MKFTEIQNEGILDNIAHPIAYAKGVLTPGQSGAGRVAQQQGDNELTQQARAAMPSWKKQVAGDLARGIESNPARLQQWATKFFQIKAPAYNGAQLTDSEVLKYLKAAYALKYSEAELDDPAPTTPANTTTANTAPVSNTTTSNVAPTTSNVAPTTTTTTANTAPTTTTTTPEAPPAPAPGKNPLFKDPAVFKAEWDKYVASKGGEKYRLISDPEMLILLKNIWMRTGGTKVETKLPINFKLKLTESVLMEDPTYKAFRRVGKMIAEQKMTEPEILKLFGQVETGASAGGGNRTLIGKGKDVVTDVASAISKAYNGVADKIQNSGPVSGFDVAVDKLTDKLADAAGGQSGAVMTAIKKYREFAKAHPIMQGAIYAGLIALTGLSGAGLGGAAILGGIKAFDKLLLGNKASSALWSGFVTGATAYGIGQIKQAFGGGGTPPADQFAADRANAGMPGYDEAGNAIAPNAPSGVSGTDQPFMGGQPGYDEAGNAITSGGGGADFTEYTAKAKDTLSGIAKANNVSVDELMQANPDITNPDVLKAGQTITIPSETGSSVYQGGVGTNADTMSKIASGDYTDSEISQNMAKAGADAGKGGVKGAISGAETPPTDSVVTPGIASDGSYQQAAPLDAAGNAMKQTSFIDLTSGNSGTMNLPDGSSVPVNVFPEGGIQPRLPMGAEKIIADLNGNKVTAYVLNGQAYVPNFKMESVVFKKLPIKEMIDKKTTQYRWALNESLGKPKPRGYNLTPAGVDLVFENAVRYQRVVSYLLSEAPIKASARMRARQAAAPTEPAAPTAAEPMAPGRPELPDEYRPDMPGGSGKDKPGFLSRAWAGAKTLGKQLTTSITAEKLKMNWHVAGKPSDSDALYQFLLKQGVADTVANEVYGQAGLPLPPGAVQTPTPADGAETGSADTTIPTPGADTTAPTTPAGADTSGSVAPAGGAGSFGDYKKLRADFEAFQEADGAMAPQVRGVLKDILLTALRTVESQQRKLAQMSRIIRESKELKRQLAATKQRAARA